jgi:hypothetical protein
MKTTFNTNDYKSNHGAAPRGRGSWAFCPADKFRRADYLTFVFWAPADSTFSDAKKAAAAHFPAGSDLVVCS